MGLVFFILKIFSLCDNVFTNILAFYLILFFCQKNLSLAISQKNNILNLVYKIPYVIYGNQKDRYYYTETNNSRNQAG